MWRIWWLVGMWEWEGEAPFCVFVPLGASYKSTTSWHSMEKKVHKRLAMWKRQYLSKSWLTLIKKLCHAHTFIMSLFVLLKRVSLSIENTKRDFL